MDRRRLTGPLVWLGLLAFSVTAQTLEEAEAQLAAGRIDAAVLTLRAFGRTAAVDDPELASIAWNNACVLESNRGRYREALADCEQALEAGRELNDAASQAGILNNLGRALLGLGQWDRAERRFRRAFELNSSLDDSEGEVINLLNLGVVADRRARFGEALRLYDAALTRIEQHRDASWATDQRTVALLNRAALLDRIGAHEEALPIYLDLLAAAPAGYEAALEANLAVVYRNLGDAEEAEQRLERAVALYRTAGDRAGLANAILNLGLVRHLNLHRPAAGETDLRRALALARQAGDRAEEIQALYYLGGALLDQQKWTQAAAAFSECAELAGDSGSAEGRWSAAEGLGRVAEARGQLDVALEHYMGAITILEGVRAELESSPRRAGFFGAQRPVYAAAVRTIVALAEHAPGEDDWARRAVEVVQRAKARELVEALATPGPSTDGATGAEAGVRLARSRASLSPGPPPEPILELFLGDGEWYAWWLDRSSVRLVGHGDSLPLLDRVERIHRALAHGERPPEADLEWISTRLLGSLDLPDRVVVAPDGRLWYLPFDLLRLRDDRGRSIPLIERCSLTYLPSGAVGQREATRPRAETTLLGFSPMSGSARLPTRLAGQELGPLPSSEREVETAARLLGGKAVLLHGVEATESAFHQTTARPGARVLHIASHTVIDERRRDGVGIVLAPSGDDDGILVPAEISSSPVEVQLAVLAACTTVVGFEDDGHGLATLSGALLAAGSDAVLATLWEVDDTTSGAFFEQFYYQLGRGVSPQRALHLTKMTLLSDPRWTEPRLWAAFILIGDAGPVRSSLAGRLPGLATLALAAALLLLLGRGWLRLRRCREQAPVRRG